MTDVAAEPWEDAGRAWGARASDWASLGEGAALNAYNAVYGELQLGSGDHVLDIACGSGLALWAAKARGARVAGIDASSALIDIAAARVADADLRVGDMSRLPWNDNSFDVVTSFNGIWATNQAALNGAGRVLRPGGRAAVMFFAHDGRLDHLAPVIALLGLLPPSEAESASGLLEIARPGVAESMFREAGLVPTTRGRCHGLSEWPDDEIAWRAAAATGPAAAVLEHVREDRARAAVIQALREYRDAAGCYRLESEYDFVIATRPT